MELLCSCFQFQAHIINRHVSDKTSTGSLYSLLNTEYFYLHLQCLAVDFHYYNQK